MNDDRRRVLRLAERVLVYLADDDDDSMRITMASTLREQADLNSRRLQDVRNRDKRIAELEAAALAISRIRDKKATKSRKRIAELEAWHDLLSEAGLINYGETPEEGVKSIQALLQQGESK